MKKLIVLMLAISILPNLCAQTANKEDKIFEIPPNVLINRRFYIDLNKGNQLKVELTDITDLEKISNIDSILKIFIADITPLKDSLTEPLTSKRIDYLIDAKGQKKIRLQQFKPKGDSYFLNNGELSSLKISQDTINIIGIIANPQKPSQKISVTEPRYFHLVFYINNISELRDYLDGILKEKLAIIQQDVNNKWPLIKGTSSYFLQKDKTVSADRPKGFKPGSIGDYLELLLTVNIQNYKKYFIPSFSLGASLTFANRDRNYKWVTGLFWEPHFLFANDTQGKLQTYRNDFLTLTYGQGGIMDHDPQKDFSFSTVFSIGYLIRREGQLIDKNTFRLGAGKLKLLKTTIEPSMYFNNFFKSVTPGIRISQRF